MATLEIPSTLQTTTEQARQIECEILRAWTAYGDARQTPASREPLRQSVDQIVRRLRNKDVDLEDWKILNRQALQLEQAIRGEQQAIDDDLLCDDVTVVNAEKFGEERIPDPQELPTLQRMEVPGYMLARLAKPPKPLGKSSRGWVAAFSAIAVTDLASISMALTLAEKIPAPATAVMVGAPLVGIFVAGFIVLRSRLTQGRRPEAVPETTAPGPIWQDRLSL